MRTERFLGAEHAWIVRLWLPVTCYQIQANVFAKGWKEAVDKALETMADGLEYRVISVGLDLS